MERQQLGGGHDEPREHEAPRTHDEERTEPHRHGSHPRQRVDDPRLDGIGDAAGGRQRQVRGVRRPLVPGLAGQTRVGERRPLAPHLRVRVGVEHPLDRVQRHAQATGCGSGRVAPLGAPLAVEAEVLGDERADDGLVLVPPPVAHRHDDHRQVEGVEDLQLHLAAPSHELDIALESAESATESEPLARVVGHHEVEPLGGAFRRRALEGGQRVAGVEVDEGGGVRPDGIDEPGDVAREHVDRLVGAGDEGADRVLEQHALPDVDDLGGHRAEPTPALGEHPRVELGGDVPVVGVVQTESLDQPWREARVLLLAHHPRVPERLGRPRSACEPRATRPRSRGGRPG